MTEQRAKDPDPTHLGDLRPDPQNVRAHNARNIGMIEDSLRDLGAARSIVIDEDGVILAGNGVVEAAAAAGIERVITVDADGDAIIAVRRRGLTPEQKKKLTLTDNRTSDTSTWDVEELERLRREDPAIFEGLWFEDELDRDIARLQAMAGFDPNTSPEQSNDRITAGDVDRAEGQQAGKYGNDPNYREVVCPKCAYAFGLDPIAE
jgi:hypothetical protein